MQLIHGRKVADLIILRSTQSVMEQLAVLMCCWLFMLQGCMENFTCKSSGLLFKHLHAFVESFPTLEHLGGVPCRSPLR